MPQDQYTFWNVFPSVMEGMFCVSEREDGREEEEGDYDAHATMVAIGLQVRNLAQIPPVLSMIETIVEQAVSLQERNGL